MMSSVAFLLTFWRFSPHPQGLMNKEIIFEMNETSLWIMKMCLSAFPTKPFSEGHSHMTTKSIQSNELLRKYFLIRFRQHLMI